ncbi:VanW family protein [bacterium]|nr:VanW family protein [bacterium]
MPSKKKKKNINIFYGLFLFIIIFSFGLVFYLYFNQTYDGKVYPNIYVAGIDIGGKTLLEAKQLVSNKITPVNGTGINIYHNASNVIIYPVNSSSDGEAAEVLINFEIDKTIDKAYLIGRSGNIVIDFKDRLELMFKRYILTDFIVNVDRKKIAAYLGKNFYPYESSDAFYYLDNLGNIEIEPESNGKKIDYDKTISLLEFNLSRFDFSSIQLVSEPSLAVITKDDCLKNIKAVNILLDLAPIVLSHEGKEWSIEKEDLIKWLSLDKEEGKLNITLGKNKISEYLTTNLSKSVDIPAKMPKFSIENGRVVNFIPGEDGLEIDINAMSDILVRLPIEDTKYLTVLTKKIIPSSITDNDGNNFGIREIIGQSSLSFAGSSVKRQKNITNASNAINGILIRPNEEFSAIKNLSPIDGTNGYEKEIVINGGSTHAEYGGGVCHLSTTLFRAILDSGLPITMRQNHSYNMPYYYPAGTDASVYDPKPDLRFINDTDNYVLIQSKVVDSNLIIQLWGTNDGRVITKGKSVVYNVIKPGSAKMVPTTSLPKGKVSCSYTPYSGADAYFDYKVKYSDGTIKERRFNSHYIPRQGVCMVGQ